MADFWLSCGHHLLDRDDGGGLLVTDEFLKAYLARPELAPPPDACVAERTLHAALLSNPRRAVASSEIAAIADPDARENWSLMTAFRDHLVGHKTVEAAYLDLVRRGVGETLVVLGAIAMLFRLNWRLALVTGVVVPMVALPLARLADRMPRVRAIQIGFAVSAVSLAFLPVARSVVELTLLATTLGLAFIFAEPAWPAPDADQHVERDQHRLEEGVEEEEILRGEHADDGAVEQQHQAPFCPDRGSGGRIMQRLDHAQDVAVASARLHRQSALTWCRRQQIWLEHHVRHLDRETA